ncbi:MAG: AI-2E family transporter [Deltaproteobacteria bacterium]|nr:AI-2E family transporter [Deltaproteobacteria bacterium]
MSETGGAGEVSGAGGRAASREMRVQTVCLLVLATVAGAFALRWLRPVMIPFVLSLVISLGLGLCVETLQRLRAPRALALPVVALLGLGALAGLGALLSASVAQLAANADLYGEQLGELLDRLYNGLPGEFRAMLGTEQERLRSIPVETVGGLLTRIANAIVNLFSQSLLVLIFVLFLVTGGGTRGRAAGIWGEVRVQVESYLVSKLLISAATGVLVGSALFLLGVPLAMAFGVMAFLLNFIPNVGSLISTLLPLPVVIVSPEVGPVAAVLAIVLPAAIQFAMGSVLEPKLVGDSLGLHPVAVLIGLIVWGMLWGVVGMLLATPMTAVLKMLLSKFSGSRPLAQLLAGDTTALQREKP